MATFSIEEIIVAKNQHHGPPPGIGMGGGFHPGGHDAPEERRAGFLGDLEMGGTSARQQEDIREGSITLGSTAQERRTLKWPHTVLMDVGDAGAPSPVAISKDGQRVAIGYEDTFVRVWNVEHEIPMYKLAGHGDNVLCAAFSPDSALLASGSSDCSVILWDLESGTQDRRFFAHESEVWCLTFSPDGETLVTGSTDASIKFWKVDILLQDDPDLIQPYITNGDQDSVIQSLHYTPDGSRLISVADQVGTIWNARTGELESQMRGHSGVIWVLAVSHKGHRAATGSEDHTARIWKMDTGEELVTIRQHKAAVWSVQFCPDDTYLVSGSYDSTVAVHHASTGECTYVLSGHSSVVHAVAFSPTGDLIVSGAADGTLKIWDWETGKQLAEMKGHADKVKTLLFSPDDDSLISSSDDGTARVWSMIDVLRICD